MSVEKRTFQFAAFEGYILRQDFIIPLDYSFANIKILRSLLIFFGLGTGQSKNIAAPLPVGPA